MPHPWQRVEIGKRRYAGSAIERRNKALALAKAVGALCSTDVGADRFLKLERVTTVAEYCGDDAKAIKQIESNREPCLLVEDFYNPGEYLPLDVYDRQIDAVEARTSLCWIHLMRGDALVKPDTLVYWK